MKQLIIGLFILSTPLFTFAQHGNAPERLKHDISLNNALYTNFFNSGKDRLNPIYRYDRSFSYISSNPVEWMTALSYKVAKGKYGAELFLNSSPGYVDRYAEYEDNGFYGGSKYSLQNNSINVGLALHYLLLDKKYLQLNVGGGMVRNWYSVQHLSDGTDCIFLIESKKETNLGLLGVVNVHVPVWGFFYINSNLRYSVFPFNPKVRSYYSEGPYPPSSRLKGKVNKQNLMWEVGFGVRIQRKS